MTLSESALSDPSIAAAAKAGWSVTRVLWLILDISVLGMTMIYKMPQVHNVVSNNSSAGISMTSLVLEFVSYSIEMAYQIAMEYPFSTFSEICLMCGQDVILLDVVLDNKGLIGPKLIPPILVYSLCFVSITYRWLPDALMYPLIMSTTPLLIVSKSAQLLKVVKSGDPGTVSALTWGMLAYMAGARVLTCLFITHDIPMLLNNGSATILNVCITISVLYFNSRKRRMRPSRRSQ